MSSTRFERTHSYKNVFNDLKFENENGVAAMINRRFVRGEITLEQMQLETARWTELNTKDHEPMPYEQAPSSVKSYIQERKNNSIGRDFALSCRLGEWLDTNFRIREDNNEQTKTLLWAKDLIKKHDGDMAITKNIEAMLEKHFWNPFPFEDEMFGRMVQRLDAKQKETETGNG